MNREGVKISQNVAAAIAHEMRNPVFGIASAAQLIRYRITDDPVMEKNIGRILREAERLNALISALLEYGRPAPVRLEPADPDEVWTDVIEGQRGALESKALLLQHTPAEPRAACSLDAEQLAQAFGNALTNAIEAAAEGSDLSIVSSIAPDGSWRSSLRNDGTPVPSDVAAHVFEPLATTKPGHAGIGLATAHRIVSEHGGSISFDSAEATGTTLTFALPAARLP
ncbi:MAG: ATP-binding region ATPase domain protein [Gemmatimonadetes bacterium]|nr:ATP-binding region ATPase domain protein [Gemmatimonadota bacterium]